MTWHTFPALPYFELEQHFSSTAGDHSYLGVGRYFAITMAIYAVYIINKAGGLIYQYDHNSPRIEVEKTVSFPLDLVLKIYDEKVVVAFGQRDDIRGMYCSAVSEWVSERASDWVVQWVVKLVVPWVDGWGSGAVSEEGHMF